MPWKETGPVEERMEFVVKLQSGLFGMSELCDAFGISRKTGYKWLSRFAEAGAEGLLERSRAPHHCPRGMDQDISNAILAFRDAHPSWGPRKLLARLPERQPQWKDRLPAPSSVGDLLRRSGRSTPRRRTPARSGHESHPLVAENPNDVWCADFKGQFKTQDRVWCYPLTVTDASTRYFIACDALLSTQESGAAAVFARLFKTYGLPKAIRTDNGCPFSSVAIGGLSRLSRTWIKYGIRHERSRPGHPQDNGRHERMHRTLKAETLRPPAANLAQQQARFDAFRREFNDERPHEALGMQTPASLWTPSTRPAPATMPMAEYPGHMLVRRIRPTGEIKFAGTRVYVSQALRGERIGLEEVDDGIWTVTFYNLVLAKLDERTCKLVRTMPKYL